MPNCKLCGRCCHHWTDEGTFKPCKYLVKTGDKTYCKIYQRRLRTVIRTYKYQNVFCIKREDSIFDFKGCPYNTKKPLASFNNVMKHYKEHQEKPK